MDAGESALELTTVHTTRGCVYTQCVNACAKPAQPVQQARSETNNTVCFYLSHSRNHSVAHVVHRFGASMHVREKGKAQNAH